MTDRSDQPLAFPRDRLRRAVSCRLDATIVNSRCRPSSTTALLRSTSSDVNATHSCSAIPPARGRAAISSDAAALRRGVVVFTGASLPERLATTSNVLIAAAPSRSRCGPRFAAALSIVTRRSPRPGEDERVGVWRRSPGAAQLVWSSAGSHEQLSWRWVSSSTADRDCCVLLALRYVANSRAKSAGDRRRRRRGHVTPASSCSSTTS